MGRLEDKYEYSEEEIVEENPPDPPVKPKKKRGNFGHTKDDYQLAQNIEDYPTPPKKLELNVCGAKIDLHAFEEYALWKAQPSLSAPIKWLDSKILDRESPNEKNNSGLMWIIIGGIIIAGIGGILMFFGGGLGG